MVTETTVRENEDLNKEWEEKLREANQNLERGVDDKSRSVGASNLDSVSPRQKRRRFLRNLVQDNALQQDELDMHQLIRDTPEREQNAFELGSAREIKEYKSTHNEVIFLLLLQRRYLHLHIKSDLDISRNK